MKFTAKSKLKHNFLFKPCLTKYKKNKKIKKSGSIHLICSCVLVFYPPFQFSKCGTELIVWVLAFKNFIKLFLIYINSFFVKLNRHNPNYLFIYQNVFFSPYMAAFLLRVLTNTNISVDEINMRENFMEKK